MDTNTPTEEFLRSIDIHELLPQQEPFVMVSNIIHYDACTTITQTYIADDNLFVEDGRLNASGMMENIAQTCAARIGYYNKYILKKDVQIGFIGDIRDFKVIENPKAGSTITTTIKVIEEIMDITLAESETICDGKTIATAVLKIALKESPKELRATKEFDIRFSEVDSMKGGWHGSYPLYFEDAREEFGKQYGLSYQSFMDNNCYAPLVDLTFHYRRPLIYGMKPKIDIIYRPTDAAKIVFDYEIRNTADNEIYATGHSVQVFMDLNYELLWTNPEFYENWKKQWL